MATAAIERATAGGHNIAVSGSPGAQVGNFISIDNKRNIHQIAQGDIINQERGPKNNFLAASTRSAIHQGENCVILGASNCHIGNKPADRG